MMISCRFLQPRMSRAISALQRRIVTYAADARPPSHWLMLRAVTLPARATPRLIWSSMGQSGELLAGFQGGAAAR